MCVGVYVLFVDLFQDDLRCLFSPHKVNHGDVQKAPMQVSLYKSHTTEESNTTEESLRKHRSGKYCQVLSIYARAAPSFLGLTKKLKKNKKQSNCHDTP